MLGVALMFIYIMVVLEPVEGKNLLPGDTGPKFTYPRVPQCFNPPKRKDRTARY